MSAFVPAAAVLFGLMLPLAPALENSPAKQLQAAATAEWRHLDNSRLGCNSPIIFTEAAKQAAGDTYLMSKLKSGDCKLLPAGKVQVEKTTSAGQLPAQSCIKPEGFGQCFWVPTDFLK